MMNNGWRCLIITAGEHVNSAVITSLAIRAAPKDDRVRLTLKVAE